jgi:uncharacterized cupin superfamily protein
MVPEARMEKTEAGLKPEGPGWFVLNARDAAWRHREGRGEALYFTGTGDEDISAHFAQLGVNLFVLHPGEPIGRYHWEADQEGFLVLAGEALLIIEGEERELRQWDFVHCPPHAQHMILGAGERDCVVLAVGSREHDGTPGWGRYTVDDAALRHGCGVQEETGDPDVAYAPYPPARLTSYRDGWLEP